MSYFEDLLQTSGVFTRSRDQTDELDKMVQDRKRSESFDTKFLAFVLVDLIPYERKSEMVSLFEKLFSLPSTGFRLDSIKSKIRDISEGGIGGFYGPLGNVHNSRKFFSFAQSVPTMDQFIIDSGGVMTELPLEIDRIEVHIAQEVSFCYYAYYFCYLNKKYSAINRETYIRSDDMIEYFDKDFRNIGSKPRGPSCDSTFQKYENSIAKFLSGYTNGLFLNDKYNDGPVPSIRILSTPNIDFDNLENWTNNHWLFLEYLNINRFFEKYGASIISMQEERLHQKSTISKGFTLLYSENHIPEQNFIGKIERIFSYASVTSRALQNYLRPLLWTDYNIHKPIESWKTRLGNKMSEIESVASNNNLEDHLEDKVSEILNLYAEFSRYANKEKINIRDARHNFNIQKRLYGAATAYLFGLKLFKEISNGVEDFFREEETSLGDLQKQLDVLAEYYRDRSNLKLSVSNLLLQKSNMSLQKRLGIYSAVIASVGIVVTIALAIIFRH